jgi:hypothetical protein
VKFLAAVLYSSGFEPESRLFRGLEEILGRIEYRGQDHPFDYTDYYEGEMGPQLRRMIVAFSRLGSPLEIVEIKLATAGMEMRFAQGGSRRVNIDPGYMDYHKVVLASFKEGPQKIYIGKGVYADPVLLFQNGFFEPLPWSFPDFKAGLYTSDFMAIRKIYKIGRRSAGS